MGDAPNKQDTIKLIVSYVNDIANALKPSTPALKKVFTADVIAIVDAFNEKTVKLQREIYKDAKGTVVRISTIVVCLFYMRYIKLYCVEYILGRRS